MVFEKRNIAGYQLVEIFVRAWPRNKPFPAWVPVGRLPGVNKYSPLYQYGIYKIGDDGLLKGEYHERDYEQN